jgi:hypothetical protein
LDIYLANNKHVNFLLLTEHWLQNEDIETVKIQDFELAAHFSRKTHIHGGCCIFVRKGIAYKPLVNLNVNCT